MIIMKEDIYESLVVEKASLTLSFLAVTAKPTNLTSAVSPSVHLGLTIAYTFLYSLLFLIVYIQLWMILYFKHRRLSFQTTFLFLCLVWAGLRTTLFSFYFKNCILANNLPVFFYWLLYCFPVVLQFITLCLLVLFFAQVVIRSRPPEERVEFRWLLWIAYGISTCIFLATNVTCAVLIQRHQEDASNISIHLSLVRVVINDSLFIFAAISFSVCVVKMAKISSTTVIIEAKVDTDLVIKISLFNAMNSICKGTTKLQAIVASVIIILLYISRAMYNICAVLLPFNDVLSFGYGWINVSDQADYLGLDSPDFAYVSFGVVLFVWEFLPTMIVVLLFRVQLPRQREQIPSISIMPDGQIDSHPLFFDNPRRYDSDDDINNGFSEDIYSTNSSDILRRISFNTQVYDAAVPILFDPPSQPSQATDCHEPQFYDGT